MCGVGSRSLAAAGCRRRCGFCIEAGVKVALLASQSGECQRRSDVCWFKALGEFHRVRDLSVRKARDYAGTRSRSALWGCAGMACFAIPFNRRRTRRKLGLEEVLYAIRQVATMTAQAIDFVVLVTAGTKPTPVDRGIRVFERQAQLLPK